MERNQALEAARALARNPSLAPAMRQARLPADISALLRVLAGEIAATDLARGDASKLQDVIERYVLAVMLYPGAPSERVLGVASGSSRDQTRAHMRLLMIWLHPDRGADAWRAALSRRVLDAWRSTSAPPPDASTRAPRARQRRPQTMPLKLTWVARPVARSMARARQRRRIVALAAPALMLLLACAAIAIFDNPLRQWAESTLAAQAPKSMNPQWRPRL